MRRYLISLNIVFRHFNKKPVKDTLNRLFAIIYYSISRSKRTMIQK